MTTSVKVVVWLAVILCLLGIVSSCIDDLNNRPDYSQCNGCQYPDDNVEAPN